MATDTWCRWQNTGLQWGRDLKIAEMGDALGITEPLLPLQWGRDLKIAEIGALRLCLKPKSQLQWGRDLKIAEIRELSESPLHLYKASMGPRSEDRGNSPGLVVG